MSDYLWNKKGHDPEVEKLEKALAVFSSTPRNEVPQQETETSRFDAFRKWWLVPSFALPVLAIAVFVSFYNGVREVNSSQPMAAASFEPVAGDVQSLDEQVAAEKAIETKPKARASLVPGPARRIARSTRRKTAVSRPGVAEKPPVIERTTGGEPLITPEERMAYEQLRKALAITSSNLSLLKQKVNGESGEKTPETKE